MRAGVRKSAFMFMNGIVVVTSVHSPHVYGTYVRKVILMTQLVCLSFYARDILRSFGTLNHNHPPSSLPFLPPSRHCIFSSLHFRRPFIFPLFFFFFFHVCHPFFSSPFFLQALYFVVSSSVKRVLRVD